MIHMISDNSKLIFPNLKNNKNQTFKNEWHTYTGIVDYEIARGYDNNMRKSSVGNLHTDMELMEKIKENL